MWAGRNELWGYSGMWRVYLQNSRDVGSTLMRARVVKTGSV